MNINELTIGEAKEIGAMFGAQYAANPSSPFAIGEAYLVRTVTHILIGRVIFVGANEIVMQDASWIADTGRYHNALIEGTLNEVEPYPDGEQVIIGRGSLIDACRWTHPLPREQK